MNTERGAVLWFVILVAIVCAVAAYGALFGATSHADRTRFHRRRTPAVYSAEAAQVWAMEQIWNNPNWNAAGATQVVTIGGVDVEIVTPACAQTPCEPRVIQTRVTVAN